MQTAIRQIARSQQLSWASFGEVDATLGSFTGECVNRFMAELNITAQEVAAVGSHGQTVHHSPDSSPAFTVQLGDATRIAAVTGLKVIADFRRADMALGGQGAPLVPPFHQRLFGKNDKNVALCNIGGIANLTLLPTGGHNAILGFDTGPGNTLLDAWCARHTGNSFDKDGAWAATGQCHPGLLQALMSDPFLRREPPKSTGVEHYNLTWLDAQLSEHNLGDSGGCGCAGNLDRVHSTVDNPRTTRKPDRSQRTGFVWRRAQELTAGRGFAETRRQRRAEL